MISKIQREKNKEYYGVITGWQNTEKETKKVLIGRCGGGNKDYGSERLSLIRLQLEYHNYCLYI